MEQKKENKKITTDDLAIMIGKGFSGVDKKFEKMDERFDKVENRLEKVENRLEKVENRLEKVENRLEKVEKKIDVFVDTYDEEKLPMRVEFIENTLNLPKK